MLSFLADSFFYIEALIFKWYWLGLPFALAWALWKIWLVHIFLKYKYSIKWTLLEVKLPVDVVTSPKAMEQVFASLWGIRRFTRRFWDTYIRGVYQEYYIFEIVFRKGKIHFFVRTPVKFKDFVEGRIYAQYPEAEISQGEDYFSKLPPEVPKDYKFYGTEFKFLRDPYLPIMTYYNFTEVGEKEEKTDPLANIFEIFSSFPDSALVVLQYFVRPKLEEEWKPQGEAFVQGLLGAGEEKKPSIVASLFSFVKELMVALRGSLEYTDTSSEAKKEVSTFSLSPGTLDVMKEVERKISKLGFDVGIKVFYLDKKDSFASYLTTGLASLFQSVNTQNMNAIVVNNDTRTSYLRKYRFKLMLKDHRLALKTRRFYKRVLWQSFPFKPVVLNTEELATICRLPGAKVKTPLLERARVKKAEPPLELPG